MKAHDNKVLFPLIFLSHTWLLPLASSFQTQYNTPCFVAHHYSTRYRPPRKTSDEKKPRHRELRMALTPVGPFCPFRSAAALDLEPNMRVINSAGPNFATDMARIQLDLQMGNPPDPQKLKEIAKSIDESVDDWLELLDMLDSSPDFQTREYAKVTQAHLAEHGQTHEIVAKMMKWQADCMRAMSEELPPPMPPAGVDVVKLMQEAQQRERQGGGGSGGNKPPPSMVAMANAEQITGAPFKGTEAAFRSDAVREEYEALCRDHSGLIEMGGRYRTFDPVGKLAFLDQIDSIEERWDIFFKRFSLMGELNEDFVEQCNAFLESMGLDEGDFRALLKKAHQIMRDEAEKERIV